MENNKTEGQLLYEKLGYKNTNAWEKTSDKEIELAFSFCEGYKKFLDMAKTEREFVNHAVKLAASHGFTDLDKFTKTGQKLKPGMKVFQVDRNKAVIFAVIGNKAMKEGTRVTGAHIDSPRIDFKQKPVYEDTDMVLMKTHYYGGIKKYQWVTIPLALHGVVIKEDRTLVEVNIGEDDNDPIFTITDLLPHLATEQMQKKATEVVAGEALNLLFGSIPYKDEKVKDKVKLNILKLLNDKYGINEEDFTTAELEIVPAFKARDVGLDKSMVGAYGQDDRSCAYAGLKAIMDTEKTDYTYICVLTDKEEIGSMGNTGAQSRFMENFIATLCAYTDDNYTELKFRSCLANSKMLSADVNAGVDPNYEGVQDKKNASFMGNGIVLQKYTGSRGKSGGSDANPEFIAEVRKIFNENKVIWQVGELGKVDLGGGGTIAQYVANLGMDVLDCGVSVLSMHAPFEVTSKIDIYHMYKAYKAFAK
ncbi:MAG: aminopeptidase [Bacillota bacterium]|nr:aminopeptidase [Bacillota bacterium]